VISTDCPAGPAEIIDQPGVNGYLVPIGDHQAIADRLIYLLDHPQACETLGERARLAAGRFAVDSSVERYTHALEGRAPT
jgi:glycosyltransferase involved in cell wall biosynthesis